MQTPQVSIIIPVFNVASYLKECLQSIINQTYTHLDIIIVDDGSSDESLAIALEFARNDERIFVISKPNGGLSSARNTGLEFIKGSALREFFNEKNHKNTAIQSFTQTHTFKQTTKELSADAISSHFTQIERHFIKSDSERINEFIIQELPKDVLIHFVDSDDYIPNNCIELCVKHMLENDSDIVVHNIKELNDETKKMTTQTRFSQFGELKQSEYATGLKLLSENKLYDFYFTWQGLFKAAIINRYALRFTEGIYHEDHDFGTLLFALANTTLYINEALYIYRQRANSITGGQKDTAFPSQLPSFLAPLKKDFSDYKTLRAYFKAYCFVVVGFRIWEFYQQKSLQDEDFKQHYKNFFRQATLSSMKIFKTSLDIDSMGIKTLLRKINFPKWLVWLDFIKDLHRQPKKIRYIKNIKYLLSKDKQ